ncbi:hypothetical protein ATCC90586_009988 [Pythium insidiosum]|nr:hypothetical protein ATCC90586_009988 [Pythium insidiosum]
MADPVTADSVTAALSAANDKKRALEEDAAELGEDDELELDETTLDDVMVSPVLKKARVDEEASGDPDEGVDDDDEDDEEDLAPPEEQNGGGENAFAGEENEDEGEEDEDDDDIAPPRSDNDIDIVTVDDDEEEMEEFDEDEEEEERDEEEEDDDDDDTDDEHAAARSTTSASAASLISPLQRRKMEQNRLEARRLIQQLDNSARSKLVLTALEKYGEELFEGHETARDAILVDACAHDSMLGLMKEAIRLSELYLRGTVEAPLEVDEDEEDEGDEDEDEEAFTEGSMRQHASADEDDEATNSEINLLSEEDETDEFAGSRPQDEENEVDEEGDNDDDDDEHDDDGLAHSDAGDAYAMTAQGDEEEYVDVDEDEGEDAVATEQGERGVPTG